jgi:hypothetical protein
MRRPATSFHRARDHKFFRCELREHGRWGVEAQFFEGGEFFLGQRFDDLRADTRIVPARELAIAWANAKRRSIETAIDEDCPLCLCRGTKSERDGIFTPGETSPKRACPACHGAGDMPTSRLQRLIRLGVAAEARQG